ncbi:comF family protein [Syntrophus gentianae]|uniref:ComF family protein n=1 Tax=Syntrophus gentianae TaxID=43775 RepID=A0A1H7XNK3_9BACT|nr:ComF family protein [Syntrophus gentianae]SEM34569.1 comF family protein [Syntrophus gentianae]
MNSFFKAIFDLLFPPRCLSCQNLLISGEEQGFCPDCQTRISFLFPPFCQICGSPLPAGVQSSNICHRCTVSAPPFEICRSVGRYDSVLMEAIHALKYQRKIPAGVVLGKILSAHVANLLPFGDYDRIIPVPLHKKRLRKRGFNQSLILARAMARDFSLPLDFQSLKRRVHTDPQIGLGRKQRETNVREAFECVRRDQIANSRILLIDDVYTTGSTVRECSRVLLEGGAKSVAVATVARA